jgi:hypothetical protein
MRPPLWTRWSRSLKPERQAAPNCQRDRIAALFAVLTAVFLAVVFFLAKDTGFLMPGPLTSAHGAIEKCSACHSQSGSGKFSWIGGLAMGDPVADSHACLTCHKMPDTAFNAHSAPAKLLDQSTRRLAKIAAKVHAPRSARAQSAVFPTDDKVAHGLYCATCHQEHQGANFTLNKISKEQCRSCHVVKFDSFDGHHPDFENYPFKRRTRIIYDHAGHFGKHFPEVAKNDPARGIPDTCATCHNSHANKRVMAVAPFEQTCTACHLDQVLGKERVSGPKGIAFLSLPGLDLPTLRKKGATIGEWPDASEAQLTPFMKLMIGRSEPGRAAIEAVQGLNLQDLNGASAEQIKAVTNLVWEIKRLFDALIKARASDVLAGLDLGGRTKPGASLVADLTAGLPRDVVISAQQQWLPNLAAEMANRPVAGAALLKTQSGSDDDRTSAQSNSPTPRSDSARPNGATKKADAEGDGEGKDRLAPGRNSPTLPDAISEGSQSAEKPSGSDARRATSDRNPEAVGGRPASKVRPNEQACLAAIFGQCLLSKGPEAKPVKPEATADQTEAPDPQRNREEPAAEPPARTNEPAAKAVRQASRPQAARENTKPASAEPDGNAVPAADEPPRQRAADQTDDLLHPTEEELRQIAAPAKGDKKLVQSEGAAKTASAIPKPPPAGPLGTGANATAGASAVSNIAKVPSKGAVRSIESDMDGESWAEHGGWYRQDHTIFYRPTGHKDRFIHSWLTLTGPQAPKGNRSAAAAVFELLAGKGAQGACTKCHSVDDIRGKGRSVNFSPTSVESKQERFTNFVHEPHFGIMGSRGCLSCHDLQKDRPYLQGYEQGNPKSFVSNFGVVKKDLCQTCHTGSMARQDCLLCHKYHLNGVTAPIMQTKLPIE